MISVTCIRACKCCSNNGIELCKCRPLYAFEGHDDVLTVRISTLMLADTTHDSCVAHYPHSISIPSHATGPPIYQRWPCACCRRHDRLLATRVPCLPVTLPSKLGSRRADDAA